MNLIKKSTVVVLVTLAIFLSLQQKMRTKGPIDQWFKKDRISNKLAPSRPSYFIAWGDPNGDLKPDLWIGGHGPPQLLINKKGKLKDESSRWIQADNGDYHGAMWIDYDNDGDEDLVELGGGARGMADGEDPRIFINNKQQLNSNHLNTGLEDLRIRGRAPLWLDINQDNYLDLLLTAAKSTDSRSTILLQTTENNFVGSGENDYLRGDIYSEYSQLVYLDTSGPSIVFHKRNYPGPIYHLQGNRLNKLKNSIPRTWGTRDSVWVDLNNDLIDDLVTASSSHESSYETDENNGIKLNLLKSAKQKELIASFKSPGDIEIILYPFRHVWWNEDIIYVGEKTLEQLEPLQADSLAIDRGLDWIKFTAKKKSSSVSFSGEGLNKALIVSYDAESEIWSIRIVGSAIESASLIIKSTSKISELLIHTVGEKSEFIHAVLLSDSGGYKRSRLPITAPCGSVVAADFDNDSDIDLLLACGRTFNNVADIVFENTGAGIFKRRHEPAFKRESGSPDSIAVADYNMDGMLDLVVSNGKGLPPFREGPISFYRGVKNENNWIKLDFTPIKGNAYPMGARVLLTANNKTQAKTIDGGVHRGGQHFKLLHFGLGKTESIEKIEVLWLSGNKSVFKDISPNQVYKIQQ